MNNDVVNHDTFIVSEQLVTFTAEIAELAKAMVAAQSRFTVAIKSDLNPHFKSKYAGIRAVSDAYQKALNDAGLCLLQPPTSSDGLILTQYTILLHTSGQSITSILRAKPVRNDPQGIGSAITYMRRYAAAGMLNVVVDDDDDDGNAASGNAPRGNATAPAKVAPQRQTATPPDGGPEKVGDEKAKADPLTLRKQELLSMVEKWMAGGGPVPAVRVLGQAVRGPIAMRALGRTLTEVTAADVEALIAYVSTASAEPYAEWAKGATT